MDEVQSIELATFDEEIERLNLEGHWKATAGLHNEPVSALHPFCWRWETVYPKLVRAGELIGLGDPKARRTLRLLNPGLARVKATTHTVHTSFQLVHPGEIAWAHRHSMAALRFVVQGGGAYTCVNGEPFPMFENDLILTPNGTWHDHGNPSPDPIIWLDILDMPLIRALDAVFFEPWGETQQPQTRPAGWTQLRTGDWRISGEPISTVNLPYRYAWSDVNNRLRKLEDEPGDPYEGILLNYANPLSGGATLPTIGCAMQALRPGEETATHRHTSIAIYHVVEGEGQTHVSDHRGITTIHWGPRDTFVVPNWAWHRHRNASRTSRAVLFSISDRPVQDVLHLYREQAEAVPS